MASLLRVAARQGCRILSSNTAIRRPIIQPACLISTSKKNKDAAAVEEAVPSKVTENLADKDENWISYGYDLTNKDLDAWAHHMFMFVGITLVLCGGGFVLAYMPDHRLRDWSQREAYLQLEYREKNGLPHIDKNLIDPAKIDLPSDEELGETEIII